ncbi:hypothetical protein HPB50_017020 [Hyalomma asiaticum]|uniref:Uncharacterized protein n=1 Tax=Hyalomma asiaticum TaxID=266040 RepID=A0ACB7RME3_HYAAI|nr:hypothetical protein HPB50_017020 [Hyalomma asiaticum]
MDPWSWQGYWCGPCGAGAPAEWPGPYAEQCPCVSAAAGETSPGQGTILRREEVWTEGGRHRHRIQEILEGAEPSPGSAGVGAERFQEAPSGFLRDGLAPSAAGSQASTRTGADRPPATRGGGRIVLDAYEEIRPPGCPPSQPLFPPSTRRQSAASVLSQASSQQAGKNKSEFAVPRGRVLYWEEDTHPVRIYAPSEPAVTTEHKMRFKKDIVEGTTTARRASTVELGNLLRGRREVPMSRELKWQSTDGQPKVPPWTEGTFAGPDATGQWHRTYDDREGGSGTYYLDMTWSTNQVNARYETNFSWSTKKAADKRLHRASISASERKRHRSKLSALEKMSASRMSLYSKTQKGFLPKVSTTASGKDSSAARPGGSSDTKTTVALEPPSDLTSPLGTQALGISRVSIATGRRLPGKSKAASLLSQAKASTAKARRDSATVTKPKQVSEVLSPLSDSGISSPHSDLLQKAVSRKTSRAVAKVEVKSPESGPTSVEAECPLSPIEGETVTSAKGEGTAQGILKAGSKSSEKVGTPEERAEPSQEDVDSKSTGKQSKSRAGSIAAPKKTESGQSSRRQSALQRFLPGVYRLMKPQDRKASTAGSRRPSAVTEKQLDKENAERETAAEAEAMRTEKPKTGAETNMSQSGESKKAVGTTDEECFASAPGSPYAMRSPSAGSVVAADRHSKEKSKSSATSKTSITSKVSKGGTSEASSVDEGDQVSKPEIEDEPKLQDHPPVAMEIVAAEEPDSESKQDMEEILRELEKQTTVIYPESNLVVVIGVLCILWICLIVFLTNPKYGTKAPSWPSSPFPTWPPFHPGTKQPSVVPRSHVYICSTDFCVKEGEHVAGLISRDVSPCDNFYQYVCRHWERIMRNPAMGISVATSVDTMLQDSMHTRVLEYILDSSHDDVIEAKRLYETCASSHTGSSTIDLMHIFSMWPPEGRWPVDNKVTTSESDVWSVAARLSREFGIAALLGVEAALDKTFGKHVVELQLPQPLFFRGDDQNNAIVSMFRGAITESAQLMQSSGMLYELMSDVMAAFKSIAKRRPVLPGTEVTLVTVNNLESGVRTFLTVVFEGTLPGNATVQYRNAVYFEHELTALIREIGPRSIMNYLGFRLLVRLAPLLPKTTNLLRLHSIESVGRVLSPMPKWVLCLRLVASVLPVCVVKAHARQTIASGSDLTSRAWLSQLESLFFRSSRRFAWMDSATHRVARFMLRRLRLARFYPQWSLKRDACAGGALAPSGGAIHMLQEASRIYQSQRLAQFTRGTRPRDVGDAFGTVARFDPGHQAVYVPFGIVNTSVPGNGTVFAFELSRMASRLYAALVPALLEDGAADESALLRFTDAAVRKLDELLDCLARDYHTMPLALREGNDDGFVDSDRARYLLLAQTAAVVLAHAAFKELLHVKRIWKFDFRLAPLPELTSEQLFFAYYARDNCECSDDAYKAHSYVTNGRLPPEQRVNFALRHLPAFGEAFHCPRDAPMRPLDGSVCRIFQSNQTL